jgi:endonuclease/exonuclease/phosphatase family metal-dependent hydrolase
MRVWTAALLLCLGLAWQAWPQTGRVRLATWNLHNLFDEHDDPYSDELPAPEQVEARLQSLSAALRELDADLLGVQEVENLPLLERLARTAGYRYAILVEGNDHQRGIDVGFLSRTKVTGYRTHKNDVLPYVEGTELNARFSRDCLEVHVPVGRGLIVLVNHFKAKLGKQRSSTAKRRAQAQRVAELVQELQRRYPGQGVAVVGDLNDGPESWALEPLIRSELCDPFASLTLAQRYTLKHRGQQTVLDHILLNPALRQRLVSGSARAYHGAQYRRCSDHFPLSLDLAR